MRRNVVIMKYYLGLVLPFMLGPVLHAFYDNRGLLVSDYYILFAVSLSAVFVFELPTGIVADKLGYKHSLRIGALVTFLSVLLMVYSISIWHFIIAEILFAFGAAFISGADSGLIYDSLKVLGEEDQFAKVYGRSRRLIFVAAGMGSLVSSVLFSLSDTVPFAINTVFIFIAFLLTFLLEEPKFTTRNRTSYREQIQVVRNHVFGTKKIWAVILLSSIVFIFYRPSINLYRPYLKAVNVDIIYYGVIFAGLNVIAYLSTRFIDLYYKTARGYPLLGLTVLMLITFLLLSVPILPIGILGMGVNQIVRGVHKPVISKYVNDLTSSDIRATTLSFVSLMNNIAAGAVAVIFSLFVNNYSPYGYVLILAAAISVLTVMTYTFIYRRYGIK